MNEYHHILVAVANKEMDKHILETAKRFLHPDVILDIINIIDYPGEILNMTGEASSPIENEEIVNSHHFDDAKQYLERLLKDCELDQVKNVHKHVRVGNPRHLIAEVLPKEFNSELIIIGRSNTHSLENVILGGTTNHVAAKAICDTLVVN